MYSIGKRAEGRGTRNAGWQVYGFDRRANLKNCVTTEFTENTEVPIIEFSLCALCALCALCTLWFLFVSDDEWTGLEGTGGNGT